MALAIRVMGIGELHSMDQAPLHTEVVPEGKAQIVKTMRFTNTQTTSVAVSVYLSHGEAVRLVSPNGVLLGAGEAYIDDTEVSLEAGDQLTAKLSTDSGTVDFVITGIERDT